MTSDSTHKKEKPSYKRKQRKFEKETMTMTDMTKVLIYGGKTGWIGGLMHDLIKEKGA